MTAQSAAFGSVWVTLAAKPGRWKVTRVTYSSSLQSSLPGLSSALWLMPFLWVQAAEWYSQASLGMEMTQDRGYSEEVAASRTT